MPTSNRGKRRTKPGPRRRNQPHEGDETPTFCIDAIDQPFKKPAGPARDPVPCDVARNQECKRSAERRAGKIPYAAPEGADHSLNAKDNLRFERTIVGWRGQRVIDLRRKG